jgi:hypothetical protein
MMDIIVNIAWYIELAGGAFLLGFGVYKTGLTRKRRGWIMMISGVILMTLFAVFGPDIIIEIQQE